MPYAIVTLLSDSVSVMISVGVFTFAAYVIGDCSIQSFAYFASNGEPRTSRRRSRTSELTAEEAEVQGEGNKIPDVDLHEIRVVRIEQEVGFRFDDGAGHFEHG